MKRSTMLVTASLLSIVFTTFHLADDIIRGYEKGGLLDLTVLPICVVWLYGTLLLANRRSGTVIMLLGGILGLLMPYLHMRGNGVGVSPRVVGTSGAFFFVWTMIALGVTALFSVVLAMCELWSLGRSSRSRSAEGHPSP
jgi:hypothetical protein